MQNQNSSSRRWPAEWESQSAIQFTFPHAQSDWVDVLEEVIPCFVECISVVARFQKVVVVCHDVKEVAPYLEEIDASQLTLVASPSNDTWARDHGALTIEREGRPLLLDFEFNGWGNKFAAEKDNQITRQLHAKGVLGETPLESIPLVLEGGSIESDGQGTLLTTAECLLSPERNPHLNRQQLESALTASLGVHHFLWLENGYLAGDDTDSHIDTLARFCSAETIAYVQCPGLK